MIKLYNSQTRRKEDFKPVEEGHVRMYVCGPTVYNYIHIGNARTFISFDTIRRYLMWRGLKVTFVQNVTDVDDKIIKKANEEGRSAAEVAKEYTEAFIADMHATGVMDPDVRPKATEEIPAMIELVQAIIDRGHAYVEEGDVYFDVRSFPSYGKLSGRNIDEMESGHRDLVAGGAVDDRKRDPLDFALWKAAKPGEPSWDSPWGPGRPGWHIECSAMSKKYLGLPLDVHGGGSDLIFPHHENETAQSEAAYGTTFCNAWMHGGMLQINSEKMSKSLGNFMLLREVLKYTKPQVLRMLMLQAHYRSPLDFSQERLDEAATSLERIENSLRNLMWICDAGGEQETTVNMEALEAGAQKMRADFIEAMDDDFNTAGALGAIFTFVGEVNATLADTCVCKRDAARVRAAGELIIELLGALGIAVECGQDGAGCGYPAETVALATEQAGYAGNDPEEAVQALLDARAAARKARDWGTADAIRDGLKALGLVIEDTPQGARVTVAG